LCPSGGSAMLRVMPADAPFTPLERFAAWVREAERILVVTGAGISADSGLPTYRGVGGLYDDAGTEDGVDIEDALSGPMMERRPEICWKYIAQVERACRGAAPNRAHHVIAKLQRGREGVVVLTQNVDGLHRAAGSEDVIEIHGNVHEVHCTRCAWERVVADYEELLSSSEVPRCPECGAVVRPRVVLFQEMLPVGPIDRLRAEVFRGFSLVVIVGTTAVFPYIAAPVRMAAGWGAHTVEINPGRSMVSDLVDLRLPARAAPTFDALADALGL
jgi:NAD-dependent deacetylase